MSKKRLILAIGGGALLWAVVIAAATGTLSFSVNTWHHSPAMAGEAAQVFAEVAFVNDDADRAYSLVNPEIEAEMTAQDFAAFLTQMHRTGRPATVDATEYQPLPGYRGMNVYVEGSADSTDFYYRLLMEGTSSSGYRVTGFWRGSRPYPNPQDRQPLR